MTDQPTPHRPPDDPTGRLRPEGSGTNRPRGSAAVTRRKRIPRYLLIVAAVVLIVIGVVLATTGRAPDPTHEPPETVVKASPPLPVDPGFGLGHNFGEQGSSPSSKHTGEDFTAPQDTPVLSVLDGVVVESIPDAWIGNNVVVEHPGGEHTVYGHLSAIDAPPGTEVKAGQPIGKVGSTGNSFAPHLHLEYYPAGLTPGRDSQQAQDPVPFLRSKGVQI